MINKIFAFFTAAALMLAVHFTLAHAAPPIDAFAQSPNLADAEISGDGRYFFVRTANGAHRTFSVVEIGETPNIILQSDEHEEFFIEWADWVNNDTLLIRFSRLFGPKVKARVDGQTENYRTRAGTSLYIFNAAVETKPGEAPIKQISARGRLVHMLPSDPDHILIASGTRNLRTPDVFKVNVRTGEQEQIQRHRPNIYGWNADRNGDVRLGWGYTQEWAGNQKTRTVLLAKLAGESEFRDLSERFEDIDERFQPLAFAEDPNQFYVLSNHETDTMAVYLFDLATEQFVAQIYHNPDFDVEDITTDDDTGKLESIVFAADEFETVWMDEDAKREIEKLRTAFLGKEVVWYSFRNNDPFAIVYVYSPTFSGQFYIYDRERKELSPLPPQYPGLETEKLGAVIATNYEARDGEMVPAYITLPPGKLSLEMTKNIPFVVLPHGGPAGRDVKTFNLWAQFLATRGYGVLQMNFRGSSGYGLKYEKAGRRQWGQLMQDDVTDGVSWLINQGAADPGRTAIFGASYGGYAALMAAVLTPDKFQCAVSFAGVTNLFDIIASDDDDSYWVRAIGDRFDNDDILREFSPLLRIDDFKLPVMIIHGRLDTVVPYDHGENLYDNLRRKNHPVEFVGLSKTGHGLNDYDDRLVFYQELEKYLATCLN